MSIVFLHTIVNRGITPYSINRRKAKLMTTVDFITDLFCCIDDKLTQTNTNQKHTQAKLYPSEGVTLALLFALKGVGTGVLSVDSKQL